MDKDTFKTRLQTYLDNYISLSDIADESMLSYQTVYRYYTDSTKSYTTKTMKMILNACKAIANKRVSQLSELV